MVSGINKGWSVLGGILLYVMDKNSVFHPKMGRGEKSGLSARSGYMYRKTPTDFSANRSCAIIPQQSFSLQRVYPL